MTEIKVTELPETTTLNDSDLLMVVQSGASKKMQVQTLPFDTKEDVSNKVTSLSSSSTNSQYPSAKCVYDIIGDVESILAEV